MSSAHLRYAAYGLVFGFVLSRAGFTSYDEIHKMFVFSDLRLFLTFMGSVGLSMMVFFAIRKLGTTPTRSIALPQVVGGVLFGIGWSTTGACPGSGLVMIGEGQLPALVTVAGIVLGAWIYNFLNGRVVSVGVPTPPE